MARPVVHALTTPAASRMVRDQRRPFVSLLSDWGNRDPSAAICRGVIASIASDAQVIDISHEVAKFNVNHGALLLWSALAYLPIGAHMAVVDPGVGMERRPIALQAARGDFLVGPDNGVLLPAAERLGGVVACHLLENPQYHLPEVSQTFHGRDLFAPAAAHLALGVPLAEFGPPVDPLALVTLDWPASQLRPGSIATAAIYVDSFGNVKLAAMSSELAAALGEPVAGDQFELTIGLGRRARRLSLPWAATFGQVASGRPLMFEDSYGRLALAVNQGNAAEQLGLTEGSRLTINRSQAGA